METKTQLLPDRSAYANSFYSTQYMRYIVNQGLTEQEARRQADADLEEWDRPLELPDFQDDEDDLWS